MAMDIRVKLQNEKIDISAFSRPQIEKASYKAINHAMAQVKTQAIREIVSTYRITAGEVRPGLFVVKSNGSNLTGKLYSTPYTKPLADFNPVEIREGVKTKRIGSRKSGGFASQRTKDKTVGVRVEITRGRVVVLRNAFLQFNGTTPTVRAYGEYNGGAFEWSGDSNGKFSRLKTFSIAGALRNPSIVNKLTARSAEIYEKTYLSQLAQLIKV